MQMRVAFGLALCTTIVACLGDQATPTAPPNGDARSGAMGRQADPLLTVVIAPVLNSEQAANLSQIKVRTSSVSTHVGRLRNAPEGILQSGRSVSFQLAPDIEIIVVGKQVTVRGPSDLSWNGDLLGAAGMAHAVLTSKGITATVSTASGLFHIEPIGGGLHAIVRMGPPPPEHPLGHESGALKVPPAVPRLLVPLPPSRSIGSPIRPMLDQASSNGVPTPIDVLIAYTPAVAAATYDIAALTQLAIDESNTSYANSGIDIVLRRAYFNQVDYNEAGRTYDFHVAALQSPSDGIMDIVHPWRDQYHADVVVLLVNDATYCGLASMVYADAATAFAAVNYTCATGYYSFAHEIGHLQGARHDLYVDGTMTPFAYGHGYVDPNHTWRTIMAYGDACANCRRVQYWSNPYVAYPPTAQPMGTTTYENDARVLAETKFRVASFRSSLGATLTGPTTSIGHSQTCQWTVSFAGGTPPYSYNWVTWFTPGNRGFYPVSGQGTATVATYAYDYNSYPGSTPVTISVSGADRAGEQYYVERTVTLYNYPSGCI